MRPAMVPMAGRSRWSFMDTLLQAFEGTVVEIDANTERFTALLVDSSASADLQAQPERVDFHRDEVAPDEHALLVVGAVFTFRVHYRVAAWGQRYRSGTLSFQPLSSQPLLDVPEEPARADEVDGDRAGGLGLRPPLQRSWGDVTDGYDP